MDKPLTTILQEAGVVGAGGAGFPTYVKITCRPDVVIANGAECEPLLHVDSQLMETQAERILTGLKAVMEFTGARRGVICTKEKYHKAKDALNSAIGNRSDIEVFLTGNYYPAGDEQQMVFEITGRVVPTGGLPIDCGALVQNVGTLISIADAIEGKPVTHKYLTVTGEVRRPITFRAPIGTPYSDCVSAAEGPLKSDGYSLIIGGPAMGYVEDDWSKPVTKTTGGIIVLHKDHVLMQKKTSDLAREAMLARAVCCQCNYCTALCPRNALGLGVEPHKVMRAVGYGDMNLIGDPNGVFSCCDCGICTYYACNFGLAPSRFMALAKQQLAQKGIRPRKNVRSPVDPARENLKVPASRYAMRLNVDLYDALAPLSDMRIMPESVAIPLRQHIGIPAVPVVRAGDAVVAGQLIAAAPDGKLCVNIHSSISGCVTEVSPGNIKIISTGQGGRQHV